MVIYWPLPITYTTITQRYGEDPAAYPTTNGHPGIDISCPNGTPVLAAHPGVVSHEWTAAGGAVVRLSGNGIYTRYCHLLSYTADDGELVAAGDEIARSDNTGNMTTGPHLHFEAHEPGGRTVDPLTLLEGFMSKLSLHFQITTDWAREVVAKYWALPGGWVKAIQPLVPDAFPHTRVLGRMWTRGDMNEWEAHCVRDGADGATEYYNALRPQYEDRRGMVTAWEGPNEPALGNIQQAYAYRDFLFAWNAKMRGAGFKTCGGSIAVGNPKLWHFDGARNELAAIAPALAQCNYWSYHGYWDGRYSQADNWWAHRYRLIIQECADMGHTLPPLIISECGCDHGGGHDDGWRARMNWPEFWSDLQAYSKEIEKDQTLQAATIFTSGPNSDWVNFEINKSEAQTIGAYRLAQVPPPQPPHEGLPTDETATDAKTLAEKCRWWLQEYTRQIETGNTAYASRILYALIRLFERLEAAQKAGR